VPSEEVPPTKRSILWRRLDRSGHEFCRLLYRDSAWRLDGTAVFAYEGLPCRLDYRVSCNSSWETEEATVTGQVGDRLIEKRISVDSTRRWRLDGVESAPVRGCIDLDLNFSPSTNLLPIRRLSLAVGAQAQVRAAWLRFPSFALEPLDQSYRRLDESTYRYESATGFAADLSVDGVGLVTRYPGFCELEASE
jgi:uncharacterized protein